MIDPSRQIRSGLDKDAGYFSMNYLLVPCKCGSNDIHRDRENKGYSCNQCGITIPGKWLKVKSMYEACCLWNDAILSCPSLEMLALADKALASLERRKNENIEEWAHRAVFGCQESRRAFINLSVSEE